MQRKRGYCFTMKKMQQRVNTIAVFSFILSLSGYSYFAASSKGRKDALTSI